MAAQEQEHSFDPPVSGVLVGYDGSQESDRALAWAGEEARLRGLPLHVVRAWMLSTAIPEVGAPFGTVPSMTECEQAVADHLQQAVSAVVPDDVEVHRHAVHGAATRTLLSAARTADLVVVGHRGRGGFATLVLGSVAEQVVRHVTCTTVVVR